MRRTLSKLLNTHFCENCKGACNGVFLPTFTQVKDLNTSPNIGMEVSPLHLLLRRWLMLGRGRKEDPAAAARVGSELLTPTLIRS